MTLRTLDLLRAGALAAALALTAAGQAQAQTAAPAASTVPAMMTRQHTICTTVGTLPRSTSPNTTAQAEYVMLSAMQRAAPIVAIPL